MTTREQFPLSSKKVVKKTITTTLVWVLLFLIFYGFSAVFLVAFSPVYLGIATAVVITLLLLIITLTVLYQRWYYSVYYYDLNNDYIVIKKGPITPHEITIPYERVQDVYVDQDLFDRMFGLYDVHLSSATVSSGMEAHIDGVEKMAADGLKNLLLKTVSEKIGKNRNTPVPSLTQPLV